jgi:acyl carrier protein
MHPDTAAAIARRKEILSEIRRILIHNLDVRREPDEIDPDTPLFGSGLGLDSVDALEIIVSLQTVFGLSFPDETSGRSALRTVNTLVDFIVMMEVEKP